MGHTEMGVWSSPEISDHQILGCFVIDAAARKTKTASDTRDSRGWENQLLLLTQLEPDTLCLWSVTFHGRGKHLEEWQGTKPGPVTQQPRSLTS